MQYTTIDPAERLPGNNERGADYEPFLKVTDFASKGIVSRINDLQYERLHHLLSTLERDCYYTLEHYLRNVIKAESYNIYEQFALDIDETIEIAAMFGSRHPWDYKTGELKWMTTDIYVEAVVDGEVKQFAFNLKYSDKTRTCRFREKFEIEEEYWRRKGVKLKLITEKDISKTKVKNIILLRDLADPSEEQEHLLKSLLEYLTTKGLTLKEACLLFAADAGISFATAFYLFKVLINRNWLMHNLNEPIENWRKYNERNISKNLQ